MFVNDAIMEVMRQRSIRQVTRQYEEQVNGRTRSPVPASYPSERQRFFDRIRELEKLGMVEMTGAFDKTLVCQVTPNGIYLMTNGDIGEFVFASRMTGDIKKLVFDKVKKSHVGSKPRDELYRR